jgi:hypothetical protein
MTAQKACHLIESVLSAMVECRKLRRAGVPTTNIEEDAESKLRSLREQLRKLPWDAWIGDE